MRIGEVNQSNYKMFLQMLGAKNIKTLDALLGDKKIRANSPMANVHNGHEAGMTLTEGDDSWKRIVPVSDEVKDKIIAMVRKHFFENGNGMTDSAGVEANELGAIMKEYRKNIPVDERLPVTWTLSKIYLGEHQRLADYVKSQDPSWSPGKPFDRDILLKSDFGTNTVDVIV